MDYLVNFHPVQLGFSDQFSTGVNTIEARRIFEQAYCGFQAEDNASGLYLSWAGLMDTFFFEWRDFTPVDRWIAEFKQLRLRHPEFPSRAVELRTYWSIGTLMHRQPQHPFLRTWSERGLALLDIADRDLSILLGGYMIVCFLWWGETAKAREIIERLRPWTQSSNISPLVYILWSCALALYHSVRGEMIACVAAVEEGLQLAQRSGLHAFDFLLRAQAARCSLMLRHSAVTGYRLLSTHVRDSRCPFRLEPLSRKRIAVSIWRVP